MPRSEHVTVARQVSELGADLVLIDAEGHEHDCSSSVFCTFCARYQRFGNLELADVTYDEAGHPNFTVRCGYPGCDSIWLAFAEPPRVTP